MSLRLVDQGQTKNGPRLALPDVGIRGKRRFGRGIVEDHGLPRAQDRLEDRLRQRRRGHGLVAQVVRRSHRHPSWLPPRSAAQAVRNNQQTTLGTGLLDRGAHERVEQLFQDDLARYRLRHFDHGREVQVFDRRPRSCSSDVEPAAALPELRIC